MREIKFRAWDSISKKMHEDVCSHNANNFKVNEDEQKWFIMQFTGLKDKNGVEIYEGDIVRLAKEFYLNKTAIVEFCSGFIGARISHDSVAGLGFNEDCEVIGNKYENPELCDAVYTTDETEGKEWN